MQAPDYHLRLPAPRLLALIPLAALLVVLAASASVQGDGIVMSVVPAVAAMWMVWLCVFNLWGHEVVSADHDVLRVEAQLAGRVIASRSFQISDVRGLRLQTASLRKSRLACGLPLFAYVSGAGLTFDYRGDRFTFAGAFDEPERADLLAALLRVIAVETEEA